MEDSIRFIIMCQTKPFVRCTFFFILGLYESSLFVSARKQRKRLDALEPLNMDIHISALLFLQLIYCQIYV
ncbi:SET domain-containing protein [Histoplasma ohiense]|nr:SET domain-containing protein [Histoplasma ohiense (nom. inval.)]